MAACDFVVKYDPSTDTTADIAKRILYSVIIGRIKAKKPVIWFIGGDSGEGKSYTALRLQELLLEIQGLNASPYIDDMNVYTPLQYPTKLNSMLYDERLEKVNVLAMHEARTIVSAKNWQSFVGKTVGHVNTMSRGIKRLIIIIISQFIRDITTDVRYTLNYYSVIRRPKGKPARLYINVMWKDDSDLEKPKLRKRKLSGYLLYPNGRRQRYVPQYFEISRPSKDTVAAFEKADTDAKSAILKKKIEDLLSEMQKDIGVTTDRVKDMVDYYARNDDNLNLIGKTYRGKWKLNKDVRDMHGLSKQEAARFEEELYKRLKKEQVE